MKSMRQALRRRTIALIAAMSLLVGALAPGMALAFGVSGADGTIVICTGEGIKRVDADTGAPATDAAPGFCEDCVVCRCPLMAPPVLLDAPTHLLGVFEDGTFIPVRSPDVSKVVGTIYHPQAPRPPPLSITL